MKEPSSKMFRIASPVKPVYSIELTDLSTRLAYFIPASALMDMIRYQGVNKEILTDYPDGVEIEVSDSQFQEFYQEYHYNHRFEASAIWNGLNALLSRLTKAERFRGLCYIESEFLEQVGKTVTELIAKLEIPRQSDEQWVNDFVRRVYIRRKAKYQKLMSQAIANSELPYIDPKLPLDKQPWCKVEMSEGISPIELFIRAQRGWKGADHGNFG